jgi:hypothetical protein
MGAFTDLIGQPDPVAADPVTSPATQPQAQQQPRSAFRTMMEGPSEQDSALGSNLVGAASTTPDAHQKAVDVGKTIGAPADSVASNMPESEKLARLQRYRDALGNAPKLQKLLAEDPDLAKISSDDLDNLGQTESTLGKLMSAFYGASPGVGQVIADTGQSVPSGFIGQFGGGLKGIADINDVLGRTIERGMRSVGLDTAADVMTAPVVPWWLSPSGILREPGLALKDLGTSVEVPQERQSIFTDIGSGVGQVAGQITTALLAGPGASMAMLFGQGADQLADRVDDAGKAGTPEGDAAIIAGAGITAITEKYGLEALLNRVPPAIKNGILRQIADVAVGGGIEAAQEVVEGVLQDVAEKLLINPDAELFSGWQQDATAAGGTGAFIRALVNAAVKGRQIHTNVQRQQRAGQDAATVEALVTGTADSKLRERNPDAFSRVMAAQTQGTPVETFYVPATAIAELYQGGAGTFDDDPLNQIDGLREQFQEALAVGGDVEISAADYLTHIAPTDVHAKLKNDLRASRDGWSVNDAKAYSENPDREADLASLVERLALQGEGASVGQTVFDDSYRQLMDTGRFESHQAAVEAHLNRDRYLAKAARRGLGEDADALYLRDQLKIHGPGALARVRRGDLDLVIARLKSGETVTADKTPVLDIVRKAGGVKVGSQLEQELRAMGLTPKTHPGLFKRQGGIGDVDNFVLSEHDVLADNGVPDSGNGYADRDAVLEALRREAGGRGAALLTQDQRQQQSRLDEPVAVLAEQLEAAGLDPNAMTADEIKAWATGQQATDRAMAADGQGVLLQADAAFSTVADRFGLTADEVRDLVSTPVVDLKERDHYEAPSSTEMPTTDAPALPLGSAKIGRYGQPENAYVEVLREFNPKDLINTEHEQDIRRHPTFDRYVGWYRQGLVPPPLFVAESDKVPGRLLTTNRRRALAAQEAGVAAVPAWYSPHNKETGLPLKYGDVMRAYAEAAPADAQGVLLQGPVATLTGEEIAPLTADLKTVMKAAREVYRKFQKGPPASRADIGDITFTGAGWGEMTKTGASQEKWRLVPALRDIIEKGDYRGPAELTKERDDGIVRFHWIEADVQLGGRMLRVGVNVAEDKIGRKFYNLNQDLSGWVAKYGAPAANREGPSATSAQAINQGSQEAETRDDGPVLEQNIGAVDDGLNLTVEQSAGGNGVRGSFTPKRSQDPHSDPANIIKLTQNADLSTALHEFGHFYLFQLIDDATDADVPKEARAKLAADLQTILDHVGVKIDVATASADQIHAVMTRDAHELWARSFEVYLREGKAPSASLRDAFASFSAWLTRIYKTLKAIPDYRKNLTPEVRGVMDRLLATDEAIKDAQNASSFRVPSALRSVMTAAEQKSLERLTEQANREAKEDLLKRVMREMERERLEWWKAERAKVRTEVEAEVRSRPVYRAYNIIRSGKTADGGQLVDENGEPRTLKLDRKQLERDYGKDVIKLLPKGLTAKDGASHHVVAGMVGFGSADEMRDALMNFRPMKEVVEEETDAAMKARHGDMLSDGRLAEDAAELVLNERQLELAALQAKALRRLASSVIGKAATRTVAKTGAGSASEDRARVAEAQADVEAVAGTGVPAEGVAGLSVEGEMARATAAAGVGQRGAQQAALQQTRGITSGLDVKAIQAAAKRAMAGKRVEDAAPGKYRAQADRLGRKIEDAIAQRDYETAATMKEQQVVNLALAKEAQDAQAFVEKAVKRFGRLNKPDAKLAKAQNIDFVAAARAILSVFGLSSPAVGFDGQVWFQRLREDNPAGEADMRDMIEAATANAGTVAARGRTRTRQSTGAAPRAMGQIWRQMTVAEFKDLSETVDAILHMGREDRTAELDGERVEMKQVIDDLNAQASSRDTGKRVGQTSKATDAEKVVRKFQGLAASLERVENWARRMDDGNPNGPFTRTFIKPILAMVYEYRAAKQDKLQRLLAIIEPHKKDLLGKAHHSNELNYTFSNKAELLHAILHTGNESNLRKLLLGGRGEGYAWGKKMPDGSVDTSRWDSMIRRFVQEGVITKADYDMAQQIWDLLEETKGPAQIAFRKMKGYYFKEVEVTGIQTPFGKYKGGYVPAIPEGSLVAESGSNIDADAMGQLVNAGVLPGVGAGFTKSRVENYTKPLELNLMKLPGHLDSVLKLTYLGPAVRQAARIARHREFRDAMFGIDPAAIDEMLVPWLHRVARQTSEIPYTQGAERTIGKALGWLRKSTGLQAMAGNVINALQQVTGLSSGMVRVKPTAVLRGLVASVKAPNASAAMIIQKSAFMKDRMANTTHDLMANLDDLLTDKWKLTKVSEKAQKHGYIAQVLMQNFVDKALWLGAHEQGLAKGMTDAEAVLEADSVIRTTQGSFNPEDASNVEARAALGRLFTMFYSYFNTQYNLLRSEAEIAVRESGWVGASPRLFAIYIMGAAIPAVLAETIIQAARGELGDDDDDGLLDDIGELFVLSQIKFFAAMVPFAGSFVNFLINLSNDRPYDDRLSFAPVFGNVERLITGGANVYKYATSDDGSASRAVKDALSILGTALGLPLGQLGKPLGYVADVATGDQEGDSLGDWARGLLSGREAPKQ